MSKMCGDTARFHRLQKQRRAKRERLRELGAALTARKTTPAGAGEKPKA